MSKTHCNACLYMKVGIAKDYIESEDNDPDQTYVYLCSYYKNSEGLLPIFEPEDPCPDYVEIKKIPWWAFWRK